MVWQFALIRHEILVGARVVTNHILFDFDSCETGRHPRKALRRAVGLDTGCAGGSLRDRRHRAVVCTHELMLVVTTT